MNKAKQTKKIDGRTKEGRALKAKMNTEKKRGRPRNRNDEGGGYRGALSLALNEIVQSLGQVIKDREFTQQNLNDVEKNFEDRLTILARDVETHRLTIQVHTRRIDYLEQLLQESSEDTQSHSETKLLEAFKEGYLLAKANGQAQFTN